MNVLRAGANEYIVKDTDPEELIRAIRVVARGRHYLSETAVDLLSDQLNRPADKKPHETLPGREFRIFLKLAGGQNPSVIGARIAQE